MDPKDVLDNLLAHTCPRDSDENMKTFVYDLHCGSCKIVAEALGNCKYKIISVEFS